MTKRRDDPQQFRLFAEPDAPPGHAAAQTDSAAAPDRDPQPRAAASDEVAAAPPDPQLCTLAALLPAEIRLGASSWSFPGWKGIVYARPASEAALARHGLAAYARFPLFRTVGIDRSFYAPLAEHDFASYAAATPADFSFLAKAYDGVTSPTLRRGGSREKSAHFLDAAFAADQVVAPFAAGLGEKSGPLVFQFVPLSRRELGRPEEFIARLRAFLAALPRGPLYAVELRNEELLCPAYAAALRDVGAAHCFNVHPTMPPLAQQAARVGAEDQPALVVRWMLNSRFNYDEARSAYAPFDRIIDADDAARDALAALAVAAAARHVRVYVIANNKAEGSAPLTIRRLAERIAALR